MSYLYAFAAGGLICLIAQILVDKTKLTPARILVFYVCLGVALTACGIYGPFADLASTGATVPLTGFGHTLAKGVKKAVEEKGLIGCLTGGLTASSAGVTAAVVFAVLWAAIFRSRDKNL